VVDRRLLVIGLFDGMPFTIHMLVHMAIVGGLTPLIALVAAGRRLDPVRHAPAWFAALPACLFEFVAVWGWHAPAMHLAARHQSWIFRVEQLTFFIVSLYFWLAILGGDRESRSDRAGTGVVALVLTFAHMTMLGVLIAVAPRDLYGHGNGAILDQQIGGTLMIAIGGIVYLGAAVGLSHLLLRQRPSDLSAQAPIVKVERRA
jgi:putative membrane protein